MTDSGLDLPPVRYVRSADGVTVAVVPCAAGGAVFTLPGGDQGPEWFEAVEDACREVRARKVWRR